MASKQKMLGIDLSFVCKVCGAGLEVTLDSWAGEIIVTPCATCLEAVYTNNLGKEPNNVPIHP